MKQGLDSSIIGLGNITTTFITQIIDFWVWLTVGLIMVLTFFGRRSVKRWDAVVDSHMSADAIRDLVNVHAEKAEKASEVQLSSISELHARMDSLTLILLSKNNVPSGNIQTEIILAKARNNELKSKQV